MKNQREKASKTAKRVPKDNIIIFLSDDGEIHEFSNMKLAKEFLQDHFGDWVEEGGHDLTGIIEVFMGHRLNLSVKQTFEIF